jgi:hypothetical protein
MATHFELETVWAARLRVVRQIVIDHGARITALEEKSPQPPPSPRSSINWRRSIKVAKALFSALSFLVRHGGILLAGLTMAWAVILPGLKWIWRMITGFIAYVAGVGIGV